MIRQRTGRNSPIRWLCVSFDLILCPVKDILPKQEDSWVYTLLDEIFGDNFAGWYLILLKITLRILHKQDRSDFSSITDAQISSVKERLSDRPRKCFDFQAPAMVFSQLSPGCTWYLNPRVKRVEKMCFRTNQPICFVLQMWAMTPFYQ